MFHVMRRILPVLPATSACIGFVGQPVMLALPPAVTTCLVFLHDRQIRRKVGQTAWPSDGFARHVLVDDLARLLLLTLAGVPLFFLCFMLRNTLVGS